MKQTKQPKQRKVPLRRCAGCMEMKGKKELIRVVRSNENEFFLDLTGKKNGRGAYVCKSAACLEKAVRSKGLERSLSCPVPNEIYESLRAELEKYGDAGADETGGQES